MYAIPLIAGTAAVAGIFALARRKRSQASLDQQCREHLSDKQVDKMGADSFPASDPPSTY